MCMCMRCACQQQLCIGNQGFRASRVFMAGVTGFGALVFPGAQHHCQVLATWCAGTSVQECDKQLSQTAVLVVLTCGSRATCTLRDVCMAGRTLLRVE